MGRRFGTRSLANKEDVFAFNSWDNVEWDPEQLEQAKKIVQEHHQKAVVEGENEGVGCITGASHAWDIFYRKNETKFFKDRHWFDTEFPEVLFPTDEALPSVPQPAEPFLEPSSEKRLTVLEVGCGVGNSLFPLVEHYTGLSPQAMSEFFIYGCDFSETAIHHLKGNPLYNPKYCQAFVHDISDVSTCLTDTIPSESIDIILLVFVLSAIPHTFMEVVVQKLHRVLKVGGKILLRDYGLYDLAQLRLKKNSWINGSQYRRGDGTLMYFFELKELENLFCGQAKKTENKGGNDTAPMFSMTESRYDNRLLVNRKRKLTMYRVWVQAKFEKL